MILFIIGIIFIIGGVFLLALILGRNIGLKCASNINLAPQKTDILYAYQNVKEQYRDKIKFERDRLKDLYIIAGGLVYLGAVVFGASYNLMRERFVRLYDEGKLEWVQNVYVNEHGEVFPLSSKKLVRSKKVLSTKTFILQKDSVIIK